MDHKIFHSSKMRSERGGLKVRVWMFKGESEREGERSG